MLGSPLPEGFKPLLGTEEANIDDKGRILVSKKKRDRLGSDFVFVLSKLGNLVAFPKVVFDLLVSETLSFGLTNDGRMDYSRFLFGDAEDDLKFDPQGRVVVPMKFRDAANLKGKVLLIGCGDRVEIWSESEWREFNKYPDVYGRDRRAAIEKAYDRMVGKTA